MTWKSVLLPFALLLAAAPAARADAPLTGSFVAARACPALLSFRKNSNPGDVRIEAGRSYTLVAENRPNGSHYWIVVPGAKPERRWVEAACGTRAGAGAGSAAAASASAQTAATAAKARPGSASYVLALSWQAAFCETRPDKAECAGQTKDGFDASNFVLHGLWPQPRSEGYCGVPPEVVLQDKARRWTDLPEPAVSASTRAKLERAMPGTKSALDRHEWIRHGTCYGKDADTYFSDATRLLGAVNASPVRALFAANIGERVDAAAIRAAFDKAFGAGAGERVRIACRKDGNREIITELTLGLGGTITADGKLSDLLLASRPTRPGCPAGIVDAVGSQ